ncbi:hypothetical protein Tery_0050 [Trichodesmium erythraeum IMS101]|uniref:Uncharacterized protein n=2 Tax=Trichodesmium erythraeum TaxID=1206 RepID=Q11AA9_TRIEI
MVLIILPYFLFWRCLMKKISNPNTQSEALSHLGVTIKNHQLKIEFSETGNPYAEPDGDRTKVSDTSTQTVTVELILDTPPPSTLKLQTEVSPFTQGWSCICSDKPI